MQGVVIKSTGSWYFVYIKDGTHTKCRIKGKFRTQGIKSTNPIAVGDKVEFELLPQENVGVITKIFDRKNFMVRKSVNLSKQIHILASNIDMAFLLVTVEYPETSTSFIDRFLVTAEAYHIPVTIVFNKIDIYSHDATKKKDELKKIYTDIGYNCIDVSAINYTHVNRMKHLMKDKIVTLFGHSGVGKSTLINTIDSTLNLKTNKISEFYKSGRHTTTFAEMFKLDFGGFIVDTPGIKSLGLVDMTKRELSKYFPEMIRLQSGCKFHNCLHLNEPQCNIKEALKKNSISQSRYQSYVSFLDDEDTL